ncbi:hypothetical protein L873DRAFT_1199196 [Choiromyces venosus 120613-1]|uniref:Uncharacterized protein n=1 Tax=Choiromyces venosus 120613-1 TaxID=1336337 RepID=A0A3N4JJB2_9PEZI|nr:hypothetical protein L873DRAFT_1199196 [Choiromyces venosus 120613-1]
MSNAKCKSLCRALFPTNSKKKKKNTSILGFGKLLYKCCPSHFFPFFLLSSSTTTTITIQIFPPHDYYHLFPIILIETVYHCQQGMYVNSCFMNLLGSRVRWFRPCFDFCQRHADLFYPYRDLRRQESLTTYRMPQITPRWAWPRQYSPFPKEKPKKRQYSMEGQYTYLGGDSSDSYLCHENGNTTYRV